MKDDLKKGINSPIYTSTSFEYIDQDDTVYPRYLNTPNEKAVAEKIASLEGAESALVFSSGMAAISTLLFTFLGQGDHAVFQKGLYGGTSHFLDREFERFGIACTVAASQKAADMESCIEENTKIIYIETPSNPLLSITDILAVAEMARRRGIITVIDNTFASPVNQQPVGLGIDLVVHSATKYMGGHSDILAGAVAGKEALMKEIYQTGLNFGGSLNAMTLYLLERSLKTIHVRVERINDNAMALAHFLDSHPEVRQVNYPGLPAHPGHETAARQMTGFGGMLSFEVKDQDGIAFQKKLKLIKASMSLGGLESICSSPAHTSHRHLGAKGRLAEGISEELIRLSVGIEDVEDLKADLEQALASK
jgi:cystathionine beta-lyase